MRTELAQQLADLKQGDQVCFIYESDAERLAAVAAYLLIGLSAGERCAYICPEGGDTDIAAALVGAGTDVEGELARGALLLLSPRATYLRDGGFDPPAMMAFLADATEAALAAGFSGFRITADMAWALGPETGCARLIEFEALVNRYFPSSRALAVCQYDRQRFPAEVIRDVLRTHPLAILDGQVCPNLYYEAPELPELIGWWDATHLERVLDNLLGNAVKYSPTGGEIRVTVEAVPGPDGDAVLTVADQGVGIPAVDLPRIFDRFRRASNAAEHADGLGIGLMAARRIVEQHGGVLGATSQEGAAQPSRFGFLCRCPWPLIWSR